MPAASAKVGIETGKPITRGDCGEAAWAVLGVSQEAR